MNKSHRQWLISVLLDSPITYEPPLTEVLSAAEDEGILLLLAEALEVHHSSKITDFFRKTIQQAARVESFGQLAMLAEQKRVFTSLVIAKLPFLVLKGGALAHWLYPKQHLRLVTDLDILISDRVALIPLDQTLTTLGYKPMTAAGEHFGIEKSFKRQGGPYGEYTVDVHWRLLNSMQLQHCFSFNELYESAIEFLPGVRGLSPVHAMLHACAHRGLNLPYRHAEGVQRAQCLRWLWDIHLLAAALSESQWLELCRLCESKRLSALVLDGLQAAVLECRSAVPVLVLEDLRQQTTKLGLTMRPFQSWPVYQWHEFCACADSISGRMQWLYQRLWPNVEAMRARYGHDGDSDQRILWRRFAIGLRRLFGVK